MGAIERRDTGGRDPYLPRRAIETRPRSNSERPTDEPTAIENRDYICKESRYASSHSVSFAARIVVMAPPTSGGQQAAKILVAQHVVPTLTEKNRS